jgi:alpha-glucosidase
MILAYHLEEMPASVTVNGKTAKKTDEASIDRKAEIDVSSIEWSWNDQSKVCLVKVPDQRKEVTVLLTH